VILEEEEKEKKKDGYILQAHLTQPNPHSARLGQGGNDLNDSRSLAGKHRQKRQVCPPLQMIVCDDLHEQPSIFLTHPHGIAARNQKIR
jgi:hypothetical protein